MTRAATFALLLGAATAALAQNPRPDQVPPPPQTQGELNSQAAKHPAKPEAMRPLSAAAEATPQKHPAKPKRQAHVAQAKPKTPGEEKPKAP